MGRIKILIGEDKSDIIDVTKSILEYKGYYVSIARTGSELVEKAGKELPQLIVLDMGLPDVDSRDIFKRLKKNAALHVIPIIALTSKGELEEKVSILESGADDFIVKPFDLAEFVARVNTIIRRNYYNLDASPLTRLPGNQSILRKMEEHLVKQDAFAVSYIDLNNFKAYNDKYGFSKGDDVIKRTAVIITETLGEMGDSDDFVGHIGGDDFMLISRLDNIDEICLKIIERFDNVIPNYYDPVDVAQGGINVEDRNGKYTFFGIMSISVGTITNDSTKLMHIGQISALASELKKYAKSFKESTYVKDRRVHEKISDSGAESSRKKESVDKIGLLNDVIRDRSIDILLQPIIELKTGEIFGHEAFCRGPGGTALEFPDELFRVARIMNKACEVDRICLEKALVIGNRLKENVKYFVNVTPETWLNPKSDSKDFFSNPVIKPKNTFLEIKVKDMIMDFNQYRATNKFFRSKGFGISVDDFGAARIETLGYVNELKPDFIKLDLSLTRGIDHSEVKQKALKIIVDIFRNMNISIIAEQVETKEEKEFLAETGVKYAQGYLFARPEKLSWK